MFILNGHVVPIHQSVLLLKFEKVNPGDLETRCTVQSAENRRKSVTDSGYAYVTQRF